MKMHWQNAEQFKFCRFLFFPKTKRKPDVKRFPLRNSENKKLKRKRKWKWKSKEN